MNQVVYYSVEIVFVLFSSFLFLFVYYRKLKEDFLPSQIFRDGTLILFCTGVGAIISFFLVQPLWFWLSTLGFIVGLVFAILRSRIPILEGLEAASLGALWLLLFYYVFQLITKPTLPEWVGFGGIILTFLIYLFFTFNYKKFTWYRSGKIGFAGLATLACFFLIRAITIFLLPDVVSLGGGNYDAIASSIFAFGLFFLLVKISLR